MSSSEAARLDRAEDGSYVLRLDERVYTVRGFTAYGADRLRVNLKVEVGGRRFVDALDLYRARSRRTFVEAALDALCLDEADDSAIDQDLVALIDELERERLRVRRSGTEKAAVPMMTTPERTAALDLLRSPDLLDRVASDMETLGYVGEDVAKRIGYLVSVSRKLASPLSMVVMSQSGSGKSALAEALERLTPPEDVLFLSRATARSLFYMERTALQHRFVIIEERAGSAEADYPIRVLQSRKRLSLALPRKDPATGTTRTDVIEILGPAAFLETTTETRINPENASRCFEVYCDESEAQTRRIQEAQRLGKTCEGRELHSERETIARRHQNAQRLLEPVSVEIPYATLITFPTSWLRTRRDHLRFLNLIEAHAFLFQHQRPRRVEADGTTIEATLADYEAAYALAEALLGDALTDARRPALEMYGALQRLAGERAAASNTKPQRVLFTRREIRQATGLPDHRVRVLLAELVALDFLHPIGGTPGMTFRYRIAASEPETASASLGLLSPEQLRVRVEGRCQTKLA